MEAIILYFYAAIVRSRSACEGQRASVINTYMDFWILSKAADAGRKSSTATSLFSFFLSVFLSVKETFYNRRALEKEDKDNP